VVDPEDLLTEGDMVKQEDATDVSAVEKPHMELNTVRTVINRDNKDREVQ